MKNIIIIALSVLITSSQIVFAQNLAERRAILEYQESVLPNIQNKLNAAVGFEVPLNVDWTKVAQPGDAESYSNDAYFTDVYFTPLVKAMSSIGSDDLGKQALLENLKGINITYNADTAPASAYEDGVDFNDGQITLNFKPFSNADDIDDRAEAIIKVLESKL